MRLLKAQNTNLRNIYGKGVKYDIDNIVRLDSDQAVLVPKGTTAERPTNPENGYLRYNTTDSRFEVYENNTWIGVRSTAPSGTGASVGITDQRLGFGDAVETIFGPLDSGDASFPAPIAPQNILVFVENVYQLPTTNYTLVQNPGGPFIISSIDSIDGVTGYPTLTTSTNHGLSSGDLVAISGVESDIDDQIENLNIGDDSSSPGTVEVTVISSNELEIHIDVSGGSIGNYIANTGKVYKGGSSTGPYFPGWYLQFSSAPDLDKPITVIHNFDK